MDRTIWVNCSSCYDSCSQAVVGSYTNQQYDQMFINKPDQHWSCWIGENPTLNSARLSVRWWTWEWRSATAGWVEFGSAIGVVDGTRRHVIVVNPERDNHTWDATHRVRREQVRKYFDKVAPSVVDHWSGCLNVRQPGCTRRLTLELVRHHPVGRLRKDQRAWNITRSNWNSEIQFINSVSQLSNIL